MGDRAQTGQQGAEVLENGDWNTRMFGDAQFLPTRFGHPDRNAAATAVDIQSFILLLSVPGAFPKHHHAAAALGVVRISDFNGLHMSVMEGA